MPDGGGQVGLGSLHHEVIMVVHHDPGVEQDVELLDHLGQGVDEPPPVVVIPDDGLALVPPRGDMVDRMRKLDS